MTYAEIDALMKSFGTSAALLSRGTILALAGADPNHVRSLFDTYFSRFPSAEAALMFDHDAGAWVVSQLMWHTPIPLDQYVLAPDNRTFPKETDPAKALARAVGLGIGWDGTSLAAGDELAKRLDLAKARSTQKYYSGVDPDFLLYATIAGIPADSIRYTSSTFAEWLGFQVKNLQDV